MVVTTAVYPYHTTVKLTGTFYDPDGQLTDPPDVRVNVRKPNGVETSYAISEPGTIVQRESLGVYWAIVRVDVAGRWCYAWEADLPDPDVGSQPADETYFDVRPTAFGAS